MPPSCHWTVYPEGVRVTLILEKTPDGHDRWVADRILKIDGKLMQVIDDEPVGLLGEELVGINRFSKAFLADSLTAEIKALYGK